MTKTQMLYRTKQPRMLEDRSAKEVRVRGLEIR